MCNCKHASSTPMFENKTFNKACKFLDIAKAMAEAWQKQGIIGCELTDRLNNIEFADHYCDGWTVDEGGLIAIGNWNDPQDVKKFGERYCLLTRLSRIFWQMHISIDWQDTGCICQEPTCGGFNRTQPRSYFDKLEQPVYVEDTGYVCPACVRAEPHDYIETLKGSETMLDELNIDFAKHGYELYRGRDGDKVETIDLMAVPPLQISQKKFVERIRETGIYDIICQRCNDENGYPTRLCAWVPKGAQRKAVHWRTNGNKPVCNNAKVIGGYSGDARLAWRVSLVTCKSCLRAALKEETLGEDMPSGYRIK